MSTLKVDALQDRSGKPLTPARAWVNFDGTNTVTIRASSNVSSITDNGVGDYTVNFSNAMADANYCAVVSCKEGADALATSSLCQTGVYSTSSLRIRTVEAANAARDMVNINVAIFR